MDIFLQLARDYLKNTCYYWPSSNLRQVRKLKKKILATAKKEKTTENVIIEEAIAMSILRGRNKPSTIYISNVGSSGSHWLEQMLTDTRALVGAGEVYFPPLLREKILSLEKRYQSIMVDLIHLIHAWPKNSKVVKLPIINTAHYANLDFFKGTDLSCKTILLKRHPFEICTSRTFRKQEYRQFIAPDDNDIEYLKINCKKIRSFYSSALQETYDQVISYEEISQDSYKSLSKLCDFLKISIDNMKLNEIAIKNSACNIKSQEYSRLNSSNLYMGKTHELSADQSKIINENLLEITKKLGY